MAEPATLHIRSFSREQVEVRVFSGREAYFGQEIAYGHIELSKDGSARPRLTVWGEIALYGDTWCCLLKNALEKVHKTLEHENIEVANVVLDMATVKYLAKFL